MHVLQNISLRSEDDSAFIYEEHFHEIGLCELEHTAELSNKTQPELGHKEKSTP